jgi:hypothetical protein
VEQHPFRYGLRWCCGVAGLTVSLKDSLKFYEGLVGSVYLSGLLWQYAYLLRF